MHERSKVWIELLRTLPTSVRKTVFKTGPDNVILAICELSLNYAAGNIKVRLPRTQRGNVADLADRTISLERKRKFLAKPIGLKVAKALLEA